MADVVGYFPAMLAVEASTGTRLRNAEAQVFDITDTTFSNPLPVTDLTDVPFTGGRIVSNSDGIYPEFKTPGTIQVLVRSGQAVTPMTSIRGAAEAASSAAAAATDAATVARDARIVATQAAETAADAAAAAAAVGATSDQQIASRVRDDASETYAELSEFVDERTGALASVFSLPSGMSAPASKERLASDRVYTLSRAEAIENAVFYGDFTRSEFSKRGAVQQRKGAVEGDGRVAVAATNLLSSVIPFTGYSVGSNTMPTGWERHGAGGTFTLTECSSDVIAWRSVTAAGMNGVIPGIRTTAAVLLPNKTYVLAFGCELDATVDDITRLQIARLAGGTVTTIRPTVQRATEAGSRATVTFSTPAAGGPWQLVFLGNTPRANNAADMTLRLSNIMLSEFSGLVPFEYRRLAGPNYSQTATPALNTKLKVEAPVTANVIVAARTDEVGFIVRRVTVTNAGEVDLSQLIPGATFTVREVFVWRALDDAITTSQAWAEAPRYRAGWMKAVAPAQWVAARTRDAATASLTVPESQADVSRAIGGERNNGGLQSNGGPNAVAYDTNRLHHVKFDTNQLKSVVDIAGNNSSSRAEITLDPVVVTKGGSQWMGFWLQVDSTLDTPNDPKGSTIFGGAAALWQLRYRPNSGENSAFSPEASIRVIQKNKLLLAIAGDLGVPDFTSEQNTTGYVLPDGAALTTQQWEYTPGVPQWVWMRFVYDPTHGQVELFVDGVQVYRNLDIPFGYTRTNTPEVRFGAYKYASDRLVVQFYGAPIPGSADLTSLRQPGAAPPAF